MPIPEEAWRSVPEMAKLTAERHFIYFAQGCGFLMYCHEGLVLVSFHRSAPFGPAKGEILSLHFSPSHYIIHITNSYAAVAEWQTRYFEVVVTVRSCEFKSHQPHQKFYRKIELFFWQKLGDSPSLRVGEPDCPFLFSYEVP